MIVGGTGLYIQSVLYDYHFSEAPSDAEFRINLEKQSKKKEINILHESVSETLILKVRKRFILIMCAV